MSEVTEKERHYAALINALLVSRDEWTQQLIDLLQDEIYKEFRELWRNALDRAGKQMKLPPAQRKSPYYLFQTNLKLVKSWNSETIDSAINHILEATGKPLKFFDDILMIIFKSNGHIYAVVRENPRTEVVVNVPVFRRFLHRVFIAAAAAFWENPYLFESRASAFQPSEIQKNVRTCRDIIADSVKTAIRKSLQLEAMAEEYVKEAEPELDPELDPESRSDRDPSVTAPSMKAASEHLQKLESLTENGLNVKKSERLSQLIQEELASAKQEVVDQAAAVEAAARASEKAPSEGSARTSKSTKTYKSRSLPVEIPQDTFDDLMTVSLKRQPLTVAEGKFADDDDLTNGANPHPEEETRQIVIDESRPTNSIIVEDGARHDDTAEHRSKKSKLLHHSEDEPKRSFFDDEDE